MLIVVFDNRVHKPTNLGRRRLYPDGAAAVPAADHGPLVLDMATATIALGEIRQAEANGTPLPEGAAAEDGTPTTDAAMAVMPLATGATGVSFRP